MENLILMGQKAKGASYDLGVATVGEKNDALMCMAEELLVSKDSIIEANKIIHKLKCIQTSLFDDTMF